MTDKKNPLEPALSNVMNKMRDLTAAMARAFAGVQPVFDFNADQQAQTLLMLNSMTKEELHTHFNGDFNFDLDRMKEALASPLIVMPPGLTRKEKRDFICGVWVIDPAEDRLLKEIKDSHHKVYNERLTYHEAYVKLEKMRVDVDRHLAMRKK